MEVVSTLLPADILARLIINAGFPAERSIIFELIDFQRREKSSGAITTRNKTFFSFSKRVAVPIAQF